MRHAFFVACCGVLMMAAPVMAKPWIVDPAQSRVTFEGHQGTSAFQGGFSRFTVVVDFDPAHPETGKITATIDTTSATAGSKDRDDFLPQAEWFNFAKFPQAQFVSTSLRGTGTDKTGIECYEAVGNLTLKGVTKPLTLPFCLIKEGDHFRAKGKASLLRTDFHIGEGEWATENYVKFAVDVMVDISVKP